MDQPKPGWCMLQWQSSMPAPYSLIIPCCPPRHSYLVQGQFTLLLRREVPEVEEVTCFAPHKLFVSVRTRS